MQQKTRTASLLTPNVVVGDMPSPPPSTSEGPTPEPKKARLRWSGYASPASDVADEAPPAGSMMAEIMGTVTPPELFSSSSSRGLSTPMEPADTEFNEEPWAATETAAVAETGGPTAPPKPAEPLSPQQHQEPPAAGKPKSSEAQAAPTQVDEAKEAPPNPPHEVREFFEEFLLPKLDA